MSESDSGKKDLTGLHELPPADPVSTGDGPESFAVNDAPPVPQVDHFESLEQIGMMDHPPPPEDAPADFSFDTPPPDLPGDPLEPLPPAPDASPFAAVAEDTVEPFLEFQSPPAEVSAPEAVELVGFDAVSPARVVEDPVLPTPAPESFPAPILEELKQYGESQKTAPFEPGIRVDFHLQISGDFDPYARDKLLIFINDHPVGLTSGELDFQLAAGRVLLPRISEFSGIKLIQELRDTGLKFLLQSPPPDHDVSLSEDSVRIVRFEEASEIPSSEEIPVLPEDSYSPADFHVLDSMQLVHYLRAEILEVEKSDLFQELLERMTSSLKRRAARKGAHALTRLRHHITPLRLPSQYQVELSASLLQKTTP